MKRWLLLAGAIVAEVLGTMTLRAAIEHPAWIIGVILGYVAAFTLLGLALREGMPLGVGYGVWGAAGVALVALLGALYFDETLSARAIVGIGVIISGVVLVETGASHGSPEDTTPDMTGNEGAE